MQSRNLFIVCINICSIACTTTTNEKAATTSQVSDSTTKVSDPLPSWNDGVVKKRIIDYVTDVTKDGSPDFIPVSDRIATFDNDGTLWSEQPFYFQLFYVLDQIRAMAPKHPQWKSQQPYKAVLDNNMAEVMKQGEKGLLQMIATTHAGMTSDQFETTIRQWIDTAKHPIKQRLYKQLVFQPMIELVKYLKVNKFKVFIVSGGGVDFMRAWAEDTYDIPKDQIIGSNIKSKFEYNNGNPVIMKLPELEFNDDKEGKPVAINKFIGRKPVFAAGNSDGDLQMLQWTASNRLKHLEMYVHHTDSVREWAYDRKSPVGTLDKGMDEANAKNWVIVDMKKDWRAVYPFDQQKRRVY